MLSTSPLCGIPTLQSTTTAPITMDRYPCVNRFKHDVNCSSWVYVYSGRCEDCVMSNRSTRMNNTP
ncbi:hypothetical protein LZ30DRAFT_731015 [Colletotrichum cereale]|nr:hypothetical protein LZ30DRAFT_731015 [Colletotrichum cereale]